MRNRWALPLLLAPFLYPLHTTAAQDADLRHAFDAGWQGEAVCEVLYEDDSVRVGRCSFPPGVGHERHFHRPHFGYVLTAGTMRIEDPEGVETVETRAGATWSSDEVTVHEVLNVGHRTTSYLIVEPKAAPER
jgi:beta-alanine degradation protein BauB